METVHVEPHYTEDSNKLSKLNFWISELHLHYENDHIVFNLLTKFSYKLILFQL